MRMIILLLILSISSLSAQQVAFTFDDLPFGYSAGMTDEEKVQCMDQLLSTLQENNIKATFLITSANMSEDTDIILDKLITAGHQTGNHTHRHFNFNEVSAKDYIADIDSCKLLAGRWFNSSYFRYSMLRRGDTEAKRDSVYQHLAREGYTIAPVSIDNNEWIYNRDFARAQARKDQNAMDSIAVLYLDHMKEISMKYDQKAKQLTGRSVKHILLLHANPINAAYLDELIAWYRNEGWEFITMDEAMTDPIYSIKNETVSRYGMSQIDLLERISN